MAVVLNKAYVKGYEARVRHLAQQTEARLRPWVQETSVAGAQHQWTRMGAQDMVAKASARAATPTNTDGVWTNRISVVATKHMADSVEPEDINQLLIDPNSAIVTTQAAGARRAFDDIIIAAATGAALDEAGATPAVPAGQILGDYTGEIDMAFVTQVNELFLSNDIPADEPKVFVIGPKMARKLLHESKATSYDFTNAKTLVEGGFVKNWMGFTFVVSNRLIHPGADAAKTDCFAMTRKAIGLQVSKDIWTKVGEDPSISFAWRIYTALTAGAVRVEDEQIVWCKLKNTVTLA